jgi:hypothetical protein
LSDSREAPGGTSQTPRPAPLRQDGAGRATRQGTPCYQQRPEGQEEEDNDERQFHPHVPPAPARGGNDPGQPRQPPGLLRGRADRGGTETGAVMIGTYLLAAVALVAFGAAVGFVAVISLASHRDKNITAPASGRLYRGARAAHGLHGRRPEPFREAAAYRHDLPRPAGREWW